VKTGVQPFRNFLKSLDSSFRRNDEMPLFFLFCKSIKLDLFPDRVYFFYFMTYTCEQSRQAQENT